MNTMLSSSVPIIRAIDITADVVGSRVYSNILREVADKVKSAWLFLLLLKNIQTKYLVLWFR